MKSVNAQESSFSFRGKHSGAKRIWHWLSSLAILALLITVLLDSTLLKPRSNMALIRHKLEEKGVVVSQDQAKAVAKAINNELWLWHKYIGVILSFLLLFRIILEFFEPGGQSLKTRIKSSALYMRRAGPPQQKARHYLIVKYLYFVFYVFLLTLVITGFCIIYTDDIPSLKSATETLKDIHRFCMYGVITFIILHIAGLLLAELSDEPGITSDMIHGGK